MNEIEHIFERLRSGTVPEKGLDQFAVGIDKPLNEIKRQLSLISTGEGAFKFLRGGYGCGKTFMSQYTILEALENDQLARSVNVDEEIALAKKAAKMIKGGIFQKNKAIKKNDNLDDDIEEAYDMEMREKYDR